MGRGPSISYVVEGYDHQGLLRRAHSQIVFDWGALVLDQSINDMETVYSACLFDDHTGNYPVYIELDSLTLLQDDSYHATFCVRAKGVRPPTHRVEYDSTTGQHYISHVDKHRATEPSVATEPRVATESSVKTGGSNAVGAEPSVIDKVFDRVMSSAGVGPQRDLNAECRTGLNTALACAASALILAEREAEDEVTMMLERQSSELIDQLMAGGQGKLDHSQYTVNLVARCSRIRSSIRELKYALEMCETIDVTVKKES